jgi:hypothetical protein
MASAPRPSKKAKKLARQFNGIAQNAIDQPSKKQRKIKERVIADNRAYNK